jgi:hypothetical protein
MPLIPAYGASQGFDKTDWRPKLVVARSAVMPLLYGELSTDRRRH